jgi:CheY-like chemotaxis protein
VHRVLVVDDDPDILETLRMALPAFFGAGLDVDTAPSAEQAQAKLDQGPYDAILSDERMPGMSGTELLAWARRAHPRALRVLMSAYLAEQVRDRARGEAGAHLVLSKPFDARRAAGWLRQALPQRQVE